MQQTLGATLIVLLLAGCGGASADSITSPTTGAIAGSVLDHSGQPLGNIYDEETMAVALLCISNDAGNECFHENFWDLGMDEVMASVCESDDAAENCLLHLGEGAVNVEADGSYTLSQIPPGQYGVVFLFENPSQRSFSIWRNVDPVQAGEVSEYDITTDLARD